MFKKYIVGTLGILNRNTVSSFRFLINTMLEPSTFVTSKQGILSPVHMEFDKGTEDMILLGIVYVLLPHH